MSNNRIRILSDLVSLDAWHAPFTTRRVPVAVYADVTFMTAHMGGEQESPVRFTLQLKRAELRIVPETQHLSVIRQSVARMDPEVIGVTKTKFAEKSQGKASAGLKIGASSTTLAASFGLEAGAGKEILRSQETAATQKFSAIISAHSLDFDGNHRWTMTPGQGDLLTGKPWSASKVPLLKLKDKRPEPASKLSPVVRVEVTCMRRDLHIDNLEIKDSSIFEAAKHKVGFNDRMIAAQALIRKRIEEIGLRASDMAEPYSVIQLAEITASDE